MKNYNGNSTKALIGTTLGFFFGSASVSLIGPFHNIFQNEMHLSISQIGLIIAIPSLTGSLLRIPFGAWVDSTGGKKPFIILLILSLLGIIGMSWLLGTYYPGNMNGLFPLVLIFGAFCGCGLATFSVGIGQTSYWFPKSKQGTALGIFGGAGTMAPGVFALVLSLAISQFSIISIYYIWTIVLGIGAILYALLGFNAPYFQFINKGSSPVEAKNQAMALGNDMFPSGSLKKSLADSAKIKETWFLVIIYFCSFGGFLALTAWLPTYWNKFHSMQGVWPGVLAAAFSILSALIRIPSGHWSDKIGGIKVCTISMILLLIGSLGAGFSNNLVLVLIATVFIAASFGLCNAATFKLVSRFIPNSVGGASGWVGGLGAFGGFFLPQVFSYFVARGGEDNSSNWGYANSFLVFGVLAIINLCIIYWGLIIPKRNK